MMLPYAADAIHKTYLYRLLMGIVDEPSLAQALAFKGGTMAVLSGWLDRFSLDLDFDRATGADTGAVAETIRHVATGRGFTVKQTMAGGLLVVLQYPASAGVRNSIKVSVATNAARANRYAPLYLSDINRYALCHTKDTMVANKMVSLVDRYERYGTIAGRDVYDIHYFLSHGFPWREEIIRERRGVNSREYMETLIGFITRRVTDRVLTEDLNYLLPPDRFRAIRKTLKEETLILLRDAISCTRPHA